MTNGLDTAHDLAPGRESTAIGPQAFAAFTA